MTTIVTRLYPDATAATAVADALLEAGREREELDVITSETGDAAAAMEAAQVPEDAAAIYAPHIAEGKALVVARVGYNPVGAALETINLVNEHEPMDVGLEKEDHYLSAEPDADLFTSVLTDHPLFLTTGPVEGRPRGLASEALNLPVLLKDKKRDSVLRETKFISQYFWPMPMLSFDKKRMSATPGGGLITDGIYRTLSRT